MSDYAQYNIDATATESQLTAAKMLRDNGLNLLLGAVKQLCIGSSGGYLVAISTVTLTSRSW